jgi:hypothetical protein
MPVPARTAWPWPSDTVLLMISATACKGAPGTRKGSSCWVQEQSLSAQRAWLSAPGVLGLRGTVQRLLLLGAGGCAGAGDRQGAPLVSAAGAAASALTSLAAEFGAVCSFLNRAGALMLFVQRC